jgi:hypothetical protein
LLDAGGHFDCVRSRAYLKQNVLLVHLVHVHHSVGTLDVPETGAFDRKRVGTGVEVLKRVDARGVRDGGLHHARILVAKSNRRVGNNRPGIVGDPTSYSATIALRKKKNWGNSGHND